MNANRIVITALLALFFMLSWSSAPVQAQDKHSLKAGQKALQFQVDDFLRLSSFRGASISVKKHTSDNGAWRLGIGLGYGNGNEKRTDLVADTVYRDTDNDSYSFDISLERLFYGYVAERSGMFVGLGPAIGFGGYNAENPYRREEIESDSFNAGLRMTAGFEWFPTKRMSLTVEYDLRLYYLYNKTTSLRFSEETGELTVGLETESKSFRATSDNVLIGLSVYFGN